jgi:hypothetical protein
MFDPWFIWSRLWTFLCFYRKIHSECLLEMPRSLAFFYCLQRRVKSGPSPVPPPTSYYRSTSLPVMADPMMRPSIEKRNWDGVWRGLWQGHALQERRFKASLVASHPILHFVPPAFNAWMTVTLLSVFIEYW